MSLYADEDLLPTAGPSTLTQSSTGGGGGAGRGGSGVAGSGSGSGSVAGSGADTTAIGQSSGFTYHDPLSSTPSDPVQALGIALACQAESTSQAEALVGAGRRFEQHPERLPDLVAQLLPMVSEGEEGSLLRGWTLEMVLLAVGRSGLEGEVKVGGE